MKVSAREFVPLPIIVANALYAGRAFSVHVPGCCRRHRTRTIRRPSFIPFRVADGYEVNLFASEKDGIIKPVQMRWDPQGRLWVSCIPSNPQPRPGEQPDDRIIVLEDTTATTGLCRSYRRSYWVA